MLSARGTSSLPHLPGFRRPVLRSSESEVREVAGLDLSGRLPVRGGQLQESIRVSTLVSLALSAAGGLR